MPLQNDYLIKVLTGKAVDRPPVWLMRQAGRILPEYRQIRSEVAGFKALVSNPQLAAEVTVQPVDILGVDAAILFSDILVIPEAMGLDYELVEKVGPRFPETIVNSSDIRRLIDGENAAAKLQYVYQAIHETKRALNDRVPLIGFAGAPWTLMSYMIEGKGSKTFSKAKAFLYAEPTASHLLLDKITRSTIAYLKAKVAAGVDAIQIFDSWAGVLDRDSYAEFVLPYLRQIALAINEVPLILFCKGAWFSMAQINQLPVAAIGLDWQTDPIVARDRLGEKRVVQGNLDPSIMLSSSAVIAAKTKTMLGKFGRHHIANLGHGVYPNTPIDHVHTFIETVQSYRY